MDGIGTTVGAAPSVVDCGASDAEFVVLDSTPDAEFVVIDSSKVLAGLVGVANLDKVVDFGD